jgi:alpha-beta hydrolase superfamily lysophospholipase
MIALAPPPHGGQPVLTLGAARRGREVILPGRGASRRFPDPAPALEQPTSYLAPTAAGASGTRELPGAHRPEQPGLSSAIAVVRIDQSALAPACPPSGGPPRLLAGPATAARAGGPLRRDAFTGGLIGPPGTAWGEAGSFGGTPVFLGCSDRDLHVPEERVRASAAVFERMGAAVTTRIYPGMGHLVNEDELAFARDLLATLAGE